MELLVYLRIVGRWLWLIAAIVLVGTVAAVVFSLRQQPLFNTSTTLLLNPASPSELVLPGSASAANPDQQPTVERLARSYSEYLRTRAFGTVVVERLGLSAAPDDIAAAASAALVPGTNFFRISVTWDSRADAQRIANGIAQVFIEENRRIQLNNRPSSETTLDLTSSLGYYERRVKALRAERDEIENSPRLSDKERRDRLADLDPRLTSLEDTYVKLLSNTAIAQANEERLLNTAVVVDPAPLPGFPSHPNKKQNVLLAAIASAALGVGLSILLEYLDATVKTARDVENVSGSGPLGLIADVTVQPAGQTRLRRWMHGVWLGLGLGGARLHQQRGHGAAAYQHAMVTVRAPQSAAAEAFRALRTNLQLAAVDRPLRSLVVTSLTPGEGKSFVAANLAAVFAHAGHRVIVVDGDLRRPSQHRIFGLPNHIGLTTLMLAGDPEPERALQLTGVPGLAVLTSGPLPPNPSELLSSHRLGQILERLLALADLVVFDSPPMTPVTDPVVLATKVDGTVLVARSGQVRRDALRAGIARLRRLNCALLGVVLNGVHASALGHEYRHYAEYYRSDDDTSPVLDGPAMLPPQPAQPNRPETIRPRVSAQSGA
jgi:non-specific protein-tyrosine kinase